MPHQLALNVIVKIKPGQVENLKTRLGTIKDHVDTWDSIPFSQFGAIHFARFVVFDESKDLDGNSLPAELALLTNFDVPEDQHLKDLASIGGEGMDDIFAYCEGYPERLPATALQREDFLRTNSRRSSANYINTQGRSVAQILNEDQLRIEINRHLNHHDYGNHSVAQVRQGIIDFIKSRDDLHWALQPEPGPALMWRLKEYTHRFCITLLIIVLSPLLLICLPFFLYFLRQHEKRDKPDTSAASTQSIRDFRDDEDHWVQNQVVAVGLFKPGLFRAITARGILYLTDYVCRHIYNSGVLSGLNTIHFARWVTLHDSRSLFFSSNYDGSLESYMNDFIDKAAWGLNGIFSNGDGFPRTRFLFCGGITDEKAYKRFLPTRQVHSRVWYSAYPHLTTRNIANNAAIRTGLSASMSDGDTSDWLARFGVGNKLPDSGRVAKFLDSIRWDKICKHCK